MAHGSTTRQHPSAPRGREVELKLSLTASQYERLLRSLPGLTHELTQRNLFLDTAEGELSARRWGLRLRREEREAELLQTLVTLKGPASHLAEAVSRVEVETPAPPTLWSQAEDGRIPLAAVPGAPGRLLGEMLAPEVLLQPLVQFDNLRTTFSLLLAGAPLELELDRTFFSTGEVEHELELEIHPSAQASRAETSLAVRAIATQLRSLLTSLGVDARPSVGGKLSRALHHARRR